MARLQEIIGNSLKAVCEDQSSTFRFCTEEYYSIHFYLQPVVFIDSIQVFLQIHISKSYPKHCSVSLHVEMEVVKETIKLK